VQVVLFLRDAPKAVRAVGATPARMPWAFLAFQCAIATIVMLVFYMVPVKLAFLLRELGVERPMLAGVAVASGTLTGVFSALAYGRLRARLSAPMVFVVAFGCMTIGFGCIGAASSYAMVLVGTAINGFGIGFVMPNGMVWLMSRVPPEMRGRASGLVTMSVFVGQFLSPLASGPLSVWIGLSATYLVAAGAMLAMTLWMLALAAVARRGIA
jgi:MFS family permease